MWDAGEVRGQQAEPDGAHRPLKPEGILGPAWQALAGSFASEGGFLLS